MTALPASYPEPCATPPDDDDPTLSFYRDEPEDELEAMQREIKRLTRELERSERQVDRLREDLEYERGLRKDRSRIEREERQFARRMGWDSHRMERG